jgi:hypothetical protein
LKLGPVLLVFSRFADPETGGWFPDSRAAANAIGMGGTAPVTVQ